jgi:hypothetical protein
MPAQDFSVTPRALQRTSRDHRLYLQGTCRATRAPLYLAVPTPARRRG